MAADRCVHWRPQMIEIVHLLVSHGASPALPVAARAGLLAEVQRQVGAGTSVDTCDTAGRSTLYRSACVYGRFEPAEQVALWLIEKGATIDASTASTLGLLDAVRASVATRGRLDAPDGSTALHWAVRPRRSPSAAREIVEDLLRAGTRVDAPNPTEDDMQAIHHAAEWPASVEVIELLLAQGASLDARASNGWTPLDYAVDRGRTELAAWLLARGARHGVSG